MNSKTKSKTSKASTKNDKSKTLDNIILNDNTNSNTDTQSKKLKLVVKKPIIEEPILVEEEEAVEEKGFSSVMTPRTRRLAISDELANLGMIRLEQVILVGDDNHKSVKYIKALTRQKLPALIELDIDALVATSEDDMTVEETKRLVEIPDIPELDLIHRNLGLEVNGIVIGCDNGMCVSMRSDEDLSPYVKHLKIVSDIDKPRIGTLVNQSIHGKEIKKRFEIYPIVKYTDLITNPELVLSNIDKTAQKIRSDIFENLYNRLNHTRETIGEIDSIYNKMTKTIPKKAKELSDTLNQLKKYEEKYREKGLLTEDAKHNYRDILVNIQIRHELISDLITVTQQLTEVENVFQNIKEKVIEISDSVDINFSELDKDFTS